MTSSRYSRDVVVETRSTIGHISVGGEQPYPLAERVTLEPGMYRAELDPATHTATITPAPEEASHE